MRRRDTDGDADADRGARECDHLHGNGEDGATGVKDAAGNALESAFIWAFTTLGDTTPPTVTAVTPANGATNVSTTVAATATFSEPMTAATITAATMVLRGPGGAPIAATVTYNPPTRTATIAPTAALAFSTTYTAAALAAPAVCGIPPATRWRRTLRTFTTGAETTPTVTGMTW